METDTHAIAQQNDAFRNVMGVGNRGRVLFTSGVKALEPSERSEIYFSVQRFDEFTEDNDPYGEHDFGSFEQGGTKLFWKIDYYADENMDAGSDDPGNPDNCYRVLMVMLASEY